MHSPLARWAAYALTALAVAACADSPVNPPVAQPSASPASSAGRHQGQVSFGCAVLRRTLSDTTWSQGKIAIYYPRVDLAADNRTVPYRFRGMSASGDVVYAAFCIVPYTEAALRRVDRRFQVVEGGGADQFVHRGESITTQGCVTDGMCLIDPIVVVAPPPEGDDEDESGTGGGGGGDGGDEGGGRGGSGGDDVCADSYSQVIINNPACDSPENPTPEEEADARSCPERLVGKVITALIPVAGRNHEFRFDGSIGGPMVRVSAARSPATYQISGPTTSRDAWWIAERGTVTVNCDGVYSPSAFGYKVWIGTASYAGNSDLHMVMGPGHPDF